MSAKKNLLFIMSLTLFISNIIYIPRATAKAALSIDSKTAVLIENNSGRILYEKNKDKEMIPASINQDNDLKSNLRCTVIKKNQAD